MKRISLVEEKGVIVTKFPDGQQMVELQPGYIDSDEDLVVIESRLNSFKDLELIICATRAINTFSSKIYVGLYVPYFLGSRSDRAFTKDGVNYLKQVICPIINSLNFVTVGVADPHSDVLEACLDRIGFTDLDTYFYRLILKTYPGCILVSPDAGAYKKVFKIAQTHNINKIVNAVKVRDIKTGNIIKTEVPELEGNKFIIIDDICDGGRTFIELSKAIKLQKPDATIILIVTHGLFTKGVDVVAEHFDHIYTTNSYSDLPKHDKLTQIKII